jgi:hypothetical protein
VGSNPTPRTIVEHHAIDEILTKYLNYLLCKKSLKPATIKRKAKTIQNLLKHGVELPNPDSVIAVLNTCGWASGTKDITIDAYRDYLNMLGLARSLSSFTGFINPIPFKTSKRSSQRLFASLFARLMQYESVASNIYQGGFCLLSCF